MATIPDVGSITVVTPPEASPDIGAAASFHGPVHHHTIGTVCVVAGAGLAFAGSTFAAHGFAESIPTLAGPPIVIRGESPLADGKVIAAHGVKEPDTPGSQSRIVREPHAEPFAGNVLHRHGVKEPEEPARPRIVRGLDCPADGKVIASHGFQEAVIWPGRPAIVRGESQPFQGAVIAWRKYADPWTPARPAIVRGDDALPFAGSVAQSRIPELAPASPRPGVVVRGEGPLFDGSAFVWRQVIVQPGVAPWMRPQVVWVFDPPPYAGEVLRARGFATAAATPDTPAVVSPPYRLMAGQIHMAGAAAGQTGGQG